jgi:hypothetical protein
MEKPRTHPFLFGIFHSKLHVHRICNYLNHPFLWKPWEPLFLICTLGAVALMLRRQAGGPPCHQGTAGYHYGYIWLNMAKTMDHIYIYIPQKTLSLSLPPFIAFRSPCPSCALKKLWHTIMATVYGGFVTVEGVPANHPKCCTIWGLKGIERHGDLGVPHFKTPP